MSDVGEGLFGIFMTFVVLAGMIGLAFVAAKFFGREPKCSDCGWREGHRGDCKILEQLVEIGMACEMSILDRLYSGDLTIEQAREMLK